jgi:hypothetical protein
MLQNHGNSSRTRAVSWTEKGLGNSCKKKIEVSAGVDRRKSAMLFNQSLLHYDVRSFNRLKEVPMKKMAKPALWRLISAPFPPHPKPSHLAASTQF